MIIKRQSRCVLAGFIPVILLFLTLAHCSEQSKVTLMSYNAGNLFDDRLDGTEYKPYNAGASGGWTSGKFEAKLAAIGRVVRNAFPGGPDIVALQEVENFNTLNQLCERYLQDLHYAYRYMYPVAGLAHQCALLSRYPFKRTGALLTGNWHGQPQRAILEAEVDVRGKILHVFVNHWKAKSEGDELTEPARLMAAEQLIVRLKKLLQATPAADIVVLGDFNEDWDEFVKTKGRYQTAFIPVAALIPFPSGLPAENLAQNAIILTGKSDFLDDSTRPDIRLYEPWYETAHEGRGSYVFRGRWLTPDHILLSAGLFDPAGFGYRTGQFGVMQADFLLDPVTGFPLKEGLRTDHFSDHLPLLITLTVAKPME